MQPGCWDFCLLYKCSSEQLDKSLEIIRNIMDTHVRDYSVYVDGLQVYIEFNERRRPWVPILMLTALPGTLYSTYTDGDIYHENNIISGPGRVRIFSRRCDSETEWEIAKDIDRVVQDELSTDYDYDALCRYCAKVWQAYQRRRS